MKTKELNIALLTNTLLSGGTEKQLVLLANTYSKLHPVTIFVYYSNKIEESIVDLIKSNDRITVIELSGSIIQKFIFLINELKKRKTDYFFSFLTFPNLIGSLAAKIANVSFIYTGIRSAYLPKYKWLIEYFTNRYIADFTIFNNYLGEQNSRHFGFREYKNIVILNHLEEVSVPSLIIKENSLPVITTIGRFVKDKDFETALKSIKILVEKGLSFKYVIIGYGQLEIVIKELIRKLSLGNIVEIVIKPQSVYEYLWKSDIYLSTSLFEGTSNAILEAMNSNLPIIATNVGDNKYLIKDDVNGYLLDRKDFVGISKKLESLILDCDKRKIMGANNKEVLRLNFSSQVFREKYFELLNGKS